MAEVGQRGMGREEGLGDGFGAGGGSGKLELGLDFDGAEGTERESACESRAMKGEQDSLETCWRGLVSSFRAQVLCPPEP